MTDMLRVTAQSCAEDILQSIIRSVTDETPEIAARVGADEHAMREELFFLHLFLVDYITFVVLGAERQPERERLLAEIYHLVEAPSPDNS